MHSSSAPRPALGAVLVLLLSGLLCGCGPTSTHVEEPGEVEPMESVTLAADALELFMEHPYLVAGERAKFNVHLTVLEDGMPIRSGKLTVTGKGPTGKTVTVEQDAPKRPGIFGPLVAFPEPGPNEMTLALVSEQATDTIRVPVTVYADREAAKQAAEAAEEEEPEGAITFLKEQAWKIGAVHEEVTKRRLVEQLVVPGEVMPSAGAKALITPPLSGRVLPPSRGLLPVVGDSVEAGQVVAFIEPPLVGPEGASMMADRAQVHTLIADIDARLREAETKVEQARITLDFAAIEHERHKGLRSGNAISLQELQESERDLRLAKEGYQGGLRAKEVYLRARDDLLSMLEADGSKEAQDPTEGESPLQARRLPLRAPLSGTITTAQATRGEFVDASRTLFTVINLDRAWVEARVSEFDLEKVVEAPSASFTLGAYPGRRFTILGEGGGRLVNVGKVVDHDSRTVTVRYELPNDEGLLRVGMFADVAIETAHAEDVVAIPEGAIVDEDGRPTAYVLLDGEHFQKRDLELGIRDSGFVQVKSGLEAGERVVTKGAYAIRLASVSAVIPAHGHTH